MEDVGERQGVGFALAQVGLAGVAGGLVVPMALGTVVGALLGSVVALVVAAGMVVVLVVALTAVAALAPGESWLTGNRGGRVCWALLVTGAGFGLWLLAWDVTDDAELGISRSAASWLPATAALFALVAGTLLRRWYLALGSLAVLVAAGLLVLKALAGALPSDVDKRLAEVQVPRTSLMVATVPGYHLQPAQGTWYLLPDDGDPNPPSPDLGLFALADRPTAKPTRTATRTRPCGAARPNAPACSSSRAPRTATPTPTASTAPASCSPHRSPSTAPPCAPPCSPPGWPTVPPR
ncbi:hypothetical protein [Nocardia sp. NRRL S-836]|uniref:hypothetical protein n=1 Tax=Nocardia sp. NRRL S-836 TaxID=1519492 RepID=UPI0006AF11E7|nr:hypothetical protein [Nocardia sp. NRRL S-836]KOV85356.1 hypothetical protein ADL03_14580 [Nocardia sp. NRRL S-836]